MELGNRIKLCLPALRGLNHVVTQAELCERFQQALRGVSDRVYRNLSLYLTSDHGEAGVSFDKAVSIAETAW